MAFKWYSPRNVKHAWKNYWKTKNVCEELKTCDKRVNQKEIFNQFLPKNGKILEAGCGLGKWVIYLRAQGFDIVGIDSESLAMRGLKEYGRSILCTTGDVLKLPFFDNTFSACISVGVIEHFENGPDEALAEVRRVLRDGGYLFLSIPFQNTSRKYFLETRAINHFKWALIKLFRKRLGLGDLDNRSFMEYHYTKEEISAFLKRNGFHTISIKLDDYFESDEERIGIWNDFPFFRASGQPPFRLNFVGRTICKVFDIFSPGLTSSHIIFVAKIKKRG